MTKNKGFTLVEMAVVLVIIGIIVGLAVKGVSVLRAAALRSQVAKIIEISNGMSSYYKEFQRLPGNFNAATQTLSPMVSLAEAPQMIDDLNVSGMLPRSVYTVDLGKAGLGDTTYAWRFTRCVLPTDGGAIPIANSVIAFGNTNVRGNICIFLSTDTDVGSIIIKNGVSTVDLGSTLTDYSTQAIPEAIRAAYELYADDTNSSTGVGRMNRGITPVTDAATFTTQLRSGTLLTGAANGYYIKVW